MKCVMHFRECFSPRSTVDITTNPPHLLMLRCCRKRQYQHEYDELAKIFKGDNDSDISTGHAKTRTCHPSQHYL